MGVLLYKEFKDLDDYDFRSQMRRAALSISNNIAEGFGYGKGKQFKRFLNYSHGSINEVKSMCYFAFDMEYIDSEGLDSILEQCNKVGYLLYRFWEKVG